MYCTCMLIFLIISIGVPILGSVLPGVPLLHPLRQESRVPQERGALGRVDLKWFYLELEVVERDAVCIQKTR